MISATSENDEYEKDLDDLAENDIDKDFEKFKRISAPDSYQVIFSLKLKVESN
mgnify:CR=1 FL=1